MEIRNELEYRGEWNVSDVSSEVYMRVPAIVEWALCALTGNRSLSVTCIRSMSIGHNQSTKNTKKRSLDHGNYEVST